MIDQNRPYTSVVIDRKGNQVTSDHETMAEATANLVSLKDTIQHVKKMGIVEYRNWDNRGPRERIEHKFNYKPAQPEIFSQTTSGTHYRWNTWENIVFNFVFPALIVCVSFGLIGLGHLVKWLLGW